MNAISLNIAELPKPLAIFTHGDNDQIISTRLREQGIWETYETELTLQLVKQCDVYVDVGANIGYYSLIASRLVGDNGKVISYEPDTSNFALLSRNIAHNHCNNVQLTNAALYDQDGAGQLFISPDNLGDHRIYPSPEQRDSQSITLYNGAQHVSQYSEHIDFIKIDTQGAEFFVVNGLMPLIEKNADHLHMIVEVCPYGIRKSGAHGLQLLDLLEQSQLQFFIIDHIQHQLIPTHSEKLKAWINELDATPDNEGFINLLMANNNSPIFSQAYRFALSDKDFFY